MQHIKYILPLFFLSAINGCDYADTIQNTCGNNVDDFKNVLSCYREQLATQPLKYHRINTEYLPQIELRHYQLTSQNWSPAHTVQPAAWQHDVVMFIPENPMSPRALVFINDGTNHVDAGTPIKPTNMTTASLSALARNTRTIVISISNVPNQHLEYQGDGKHLREDDSVARSWTLFLDHPEQHPLMPLHIPMAAAVSQAMSLAERELIPWKIDRFIVSGMSKRGWTTWLSAIADSRVDAIVPFVIDLLGTRPALQHIYQSYGHHWPLAFYPYYQANIDTQIQTTPFTKLMQIEDPLLYLQSTYRPRLAIAKYIVNASGDDFYVPDNSRFYYDQLPGEKSLRVTPNTDHGGIRKFAEQSLTAFINRIQHNNAIPKIDTILDTTQLTVHFSELPVNIKRWTAINPVARDFRYACGIRYFASPLTPTPQLDIHLDMPSTGWEATFIEATFSDGYIATTPVYITPDDQYPTVAPPSDGANCQTLPGRGLGTD